jgi:hypothetical protein
MNIADTYGKVEETFSLRTKDYSESLRLVKSKSVEVDERFEVYRKVPAHYTLLENRPS